MSATELYIPSPMQFAAHTCPADELLYGGAAGGGKTEFQIQEGRRQGLAYPGSQSVFFRRLNQNLNAPRNRAEKLLAGEARWVGGDQRQFRYVNGSIYRFSHMQQAKHKESHDGEEYDLVQFDEGQSFAPEQIDYLRTRNRTAVHRSWARLRISAMPGGVAHYYLRVNFVRPKVYEEEIAEVLWYWPWNEAKQLWDEIVRKYDLRLREDQEQAKIEWNQRRIEEGLDWRQFAPGERYTHKGPMEWSPVDDLRYIVWRPYQTPEEIELGVEARTRCFLPALVSDNPTYAMDAAYISTLARQPEAIRRRLLDGDWTVFEGQFFKEFTEETHVIDPFTPPPQWTCWRSLDWGMKEWGVVGWHTINPENGQKITYREYRFKESGVRQVAQDVLGMTGHQEIVVKTSADPAIFKRQGSASESRALSDDFADAGLVLTPANNARVPGWSKVQSDMTINPSTGKPYWVVTRNCQYLINTLPGLVHSEHNPEDVDTDGEDHAADMLRYGLMEAPNDIAGPLSFSINLGSLVTG